MLTPVTGKVLSRSINATDKAIQVTERVLDRSICPQLTVQQAPNKLIFPTLTEDQKRIELKAAAYREEIARKAMAQVCKNSPRLTLVQTSECDGLIKSARN